ncbi:MAG: hypothetical protein P8099_20755, partial [Gemmatimonadota bacterium]
MAYELEVDGEGRRARVVLTGPISVAEHIAWFRELVAHPAWFPGFDVLVDARGLVGPLRYPEATRVANVARRLDEQLGAGRHALVGDTDVLYGCCRMAE